MDINSNTITVPDNRLRLQTADYSTNFTSSSEELEALEFESSELGKLEFVSGKFTFLNEVLEALAKFLNVKKFPNWFKSIGNWLKGIGFENGKVPHWLEGIANTVAGSAIAVNSAIKFRTSGWQSAITSFFGGLAFGLVGPNVLLKEKEQKFLGLKLPGLDITNKIPELLENHLLKGKENEITKFMKGGIGKGLQTLAVIFLMDRLLVTLEKFVEKRWGKKKNKEIKKTPNQKEILSNNSLTQNQISNR